MSLESWTPSAQLFTDIKPLPGMHRCAVSFAVTIPFCYVKMVQRPWLIANVIANVSVDKLGRACGTALWLK